MKIKLLNKYLVVLVIGLFLSMTINFPTNAEAAWRQSGPPEDKSSNSILIPVVAVATVLTLVYLFVTSGQKKGDETGTTHPASPANPDISSLQKDSKEWISKPFRDPFNSNYLGKIGSDRVLPVSVSEGLLSRKPGEYGREGIQRLGVGTIEKRYSISTPDFNPSMPGVAPEINPE